MSADLNLFKVKRDEPEWLYFEPDAGSIYMGLLASSLSKKLNLEPITDKEDYQNGLLRSQLTPSASPNMIVSLVLEELLPAPKENIPVNKIIKFKEKHERELLSFRRLIGNTIKLLEEVREEEQFKRVLNCAKDDIKEQCIILNRKLKENRIETVFNVLQTSFLLRLPEAIPIIGVGTISVKVGAVVFGVNALIKIVRETFNGIVRRNSILESNPFAYVFYVKKKFI